MQNGRNKVKYRIENKGGTAMEQPIFKRVLLKISGEALAGDKHF